MSKPVIQIESIGKRYRLGQQQASYLSLREELSKRFARKGRRETATQGEFWALRDISFNVQQGEAVGIIGRNGAGKSTLLKLLSRITPPTEGRITLRGRVASLLEVGTGFHPELTGRENIYLNGAVLGMTRREIAQRFDEIIAFAETEDFLETPVKRYSSGMYVRLAFAVAAHLNPEILLVDEVLAVGDARFQKKCLGRMGDVARGGRTVLFVSHNMAAVQALCGRAITLQQGRVIFEGDPSSAIERYAHSADVEQHVALSDRQDRAGNGRARVLDLVIRDATGRPTDAIGMGEDFSVTLVIEGEIGNAVIGILIGTPFVRQICRGYTYESFPGDIAIRGRSVVTCYFRDVPLVHGTYSIHTWVGGLKGDVADEVDDAATLEVREKDVFGTGRLLNRQHNLFFVRHSWEIRDACSSAGKGAWVRS